MGKKDSYRKIFAEQIIDNFADAVIVFDVQTREIILCNPAVEKLFGYTTEEILKKNISSIYENEENFDIFYKKVLMDLDFNLSFKSEFRFRKKDGSKFYAKVVVTGICNEEKQLETIKGIRNQQISL